MTTGFSEAALAALRTTAAGFIGDTTVPGVAYLIASGDEVHVETMGTLSVGGAPVQRDSIFRIASMTKPMIAAATLALVGEGLLALDEPVDRLLPELANRQVLKRGDGPLDETVPANRAITVHDLLTFTLGFGLPIESMGAESPWPIVTATETLNLATLGMPEPDRQPDPDTWIAGLGSLPLIAQPGERWMYNTGASVLGVLLARAAGAPLPEVMRTRLFEPLGMTSTGFWVTDTSRLATAYGSPDESGALTIWDNPDGYWSGPTAFPDGASGLASTVDDVYAFTQMLRTGGGSVLRPDLARAMTTGQLTDAQKAHGGFTPDVFDHANWGYLLMVQDAGDYGWDGGLGSSMTIDPVHDVTVIVLTQRLFDSPEPPPIHAAIKQAAYAARLS